jgi:hypothetical protein
MKWLKTVLNDNHSVTISCVLVALFLVWFISCQATVESLLTPGKKVTRGELEAEWKYYSAVMKSRTADLDSQDSLRQLILDQSNLFLQTGSVSPVGLGGLLVSVGAIGFGLDQRRKAQAATKKKPDVSTG